MKDTPALSMNKCRTARHAQHSHLLTHTHTAALLLSRSLFRLQKNGDGRRAIGADRRDGFGPVILLVLLNPKGGAVSALTTLPERKCMGLVTGVAGRHGHLRRGRGRHDHPRRRRAPTRTGSRSGSRRASRDPVAMPADRGDYDSGIGCQHGGRHARAPAGRADCQLPAALGGAPAELARVAVDARPRLVGRGRARRARRTARARARAARRTRATPRRR